MIKSKHIVSYCEAYEIDIIICGTYGNNCCNGGYGKIDGIECQDCPEAYDTQDLL